MRGAATDRTDCSFVVGSDTTEQAAAIGVMCRQFLSEKNCTRVGVIFSSAGALPRLVASQLSNLDIPHNDGFGHPMPGLFESAEWRAWLQLQRGPRVNPLLRFLSALSNREKLFPEVELQVFERTLRSAHADILIDDLTVLREFCVADPKEKTQAIVKALQLIEFLPERGTLSEFLHATENAFAKVNWKLHWMEIENRSSDWAGKFEVNFSRTLYLRWLEEIASTFGSGREAAGDQAIRTVDGAQLHRRQHRRRYRNGGSRQTS
jgi:hypothetical protein